MNNKIEEINSNFGKINLRESILNALAIRENSEKDSDIYNWATNIVEKLQKIQTELDDFKDLFYIIANKI
jgi:hypothetical protein